METRKRKVSKTVYSYYSNDKPFVFMVYELIIIQYHAARDLSAWKRLMWLESKHGPLPGTKAKVFQLTSKLDNVSINSYTIL